MRFVKQFVFIIVWALLAPSLYARWGLLFYSGCNMAHVSMLYSNKNCSHIYCDLDNYRNVLNKYRNFYKKLQQKSHELCYALAKSVVWNNNQLEPGVDFTLRERFLDVDLTTFIVTEGGFGVHDDPSSLNSCASKISSELREYYEAVVSIFSKEEGFKVSDFKPAEIIGEPGDTQKLRFYPVYIEHKDFPLYKARVLKGSGSSGDGEIAEIPSRLFYSATLLEWNISLINQSGRSDVLTSWYDTYGYDFMAGTFSTENCRSSNNKTNMLFGLSVGWGQSFIKEGRDFGIYLGSELFYEINPTKTRVSSKDKSDSCEIRSSGIGVTQLVGLASKNNWMLYALGGVRYSFKRLNFNSKKLHRNKLEFDVGGGTTYMMSQNFALNFRVVHTLRTKTKLAEGKHLKASSTKIIVGLSYMFG